MLTSPRNLRLGALILAFVAINQIDDPMVGATIGQELVYWSVRLAALAGGLWIADWLDRRFVPGRWNKPAWLRPVVLVSAVGMLPFSIAEIAMEPHLPMRPEYIDDELWAISPLLAWLSEYVTILSILVPVHLLLWLIIDRRAHAPLPDRVEPVRLPPFLIGTSARKLEDVQALQAEEHYVRVYTEQGAELVHCRFGDAVDSMPDELGLRVHRSWWVAESAVRSAKRGSRRWQLGITGDVTVPVSDSFVQAVRERGWLKKKRQN